MAEFASRPEEIARVLRDDILRGRYGPGERLPSERELAARLDANRSSVREALKKLEQLRLIEIRRGGGARVSPVDEASLDVLAHLLALDEGPDPVLVAQWLDVHELILAGAVRLAVERASDDEVARARALLGRLADAELSDDDYLEASDALAELISAASRNLVLRMVRSALRSLFTTRWPPGPRRLRPPPEVLGPIARAIDAALVERDAAAAEEGVRRLLRSGRERLLKALEARAARR
jgi:GntR family transcriptional repressor for pyruvate dehydrogenase complex